MALVPAVDPAADDYTLAEPARLDLGRLDTVDLDAWSSTLEGVLEAMPDEVTVYPSENYLYFTFRTADEEIRGNLRLSAADRDEGILHFAYYEHPAGPGQRGTSYQVLGPTEGVDVQRVGFEIYDVSFRGETLRATLHDLDQTPPASGILTDDETFVFRTLDESRFGFILAFDQTTDSFLWVLDESRPLPEVLVPAGEDLVRGPGSEFVFQVEDDEAERKVLTGVARHQARSNTYYDGPFDQLADNDIGTFDDLAIYIERAFPSVAGNIDMYGQFLDQDHKRVAIVPYAYYTSLSELIPGGSDAGSVPASHSSPTCVQPAALGVSWPGDPFEIAEEMGIHDGQKTVIHQQSVSWPDDVFEDTTAALGIHDGEKTVIHQQSVSWPDDVFDEAARALGVHDGERTIIHEQGVSWPEDIEWPEAVRGLVDGQVYHDGQLTTIHYQAVSWPDDVLDDTAREMGIHDGQKTVIHQQGASWPDDVFEDTAAALGIHDGEKTVIHQQSVSWPDDVFDEVEEITGVYHVPDTSATCTEASTDTHIPDVSMAHSPEISAMVPGAPVVHDPATTRTCTDPPGWPPAGLEALAHHSHVSVFYDDAFGSENGTDPIFDPEDPLGVAERCTPAPGDGAEPVCAAPSVHIPGTSEIFHPLPLEDLVQEDVTPALFEPLPVVHDAETSRTCTDPIGWPPWTS